MENDDEDKYTSVSDDPLSNLILEVIKNDSLRKIERGKRHEAEHCILTAAKLISPVSFCEIMHLIFYYIKENREIQFESAEKCVVGFRAPDPSL